MLGLNLSFGKPNIITDASNIFSSRVNIVSLEGNIIIDEELKQKSLDAAMTTIMRRINNSIQIMIFRKLVIKSPYAIFICISDLDLNRAHDLALFEG